MSNRINEQVRSLIAIGAQNITGSGFTGPWVSLAHFRRCLITLKQAAWAGGTCAVTVNQAKDASGTGSKAVSFDTSWQRTLTNDVAVKTTGLTGTATLPNQANTLTEIEVNARQDLDCSGGFFFIQVATASPGANADFLEVDYLLSDPVYQGAQETFPSALA
jgi:hypothetical protein